MLNYPTASGLVEKVIARSPKGDAAISKLLYIIHSDCFAYARNDWN